MILFAGRVYRAAASDPMVQTEYYTEATGMAVSATCIGLALTGIQFATIVRRDEERSGGRRPPA